MMNILFVCTGNTCRSPMAAAIMDKLAYDDGLDIRVESAGLFATDGESATPEAVEALKKYDIDMSSHKSQLINDELIKKSDLIITMTTAHKMILNDIAGEKTYTVSELAEISEEIEDPFGGDIKDYEKTADMLFIALSEIENKIFKIQEECENNEKDN